jgi:predicted DNA-binding transcriptional regulator AlpA
MQDDLLIDAREAAKILGISASSLRRLVDGGKAPPPRRLGRLIRWPRAAQSDEAEHRFRSKVNTHSDRR